MFELEDLSGKVIEKRFYRQQLRKADLGMKPKVDKITKFITTRNKGKDYLENA